MVSQRKLIANRQNAQKSTGPRTQEGKKRISQNAMTHALYCKDLLLPCEDQSLFKALRDSYLRNLSPQDLLELNLVDQIVSATWRLRRLQSAEQDLHHESAQDIDVQRHMILMHLPSARSRKIPGHIATAQLLCNDNLSPAFERLARHEQRLQRTIHRCLKELRLLRKDPADSFPCPYLDDPQTDEIKPTDPDSSLWTSP